MTAKGIITMDFPKLSKEVIERLKHEWEKTTIGSKTYVTPIIQDHEWPNLITPEIEAHDMKELIKDL